MVDAVVLLFLRLQVEAPERHKREALSYGWDIASLNFSDATSIHGWERWHTLSSLLTTTIANRLLGICE